MEQGHAGVRWIRPNDPEKEALEKTPSDEVVLSGGVWEP